MNICRQIFLSICLLAGLQAMATEAQPLDTVYFYKSWEQIIYMEPLTMLVNPYIEAYSPFEVNIYSDDEEVNKILIDAGFIAASIGDSIWYVTSDYLKDNFKGDVIQFDGFVPLFFNDKTAFLTWPSKASFKEIVFGDTEGSNYNVDYYHIDFPNHKIKRVTHNYLSKLLEDYHDLQMRYEGMKDYKKRHIIEDYFFKYIDRSTDDFMKPFILDIVDENGSSIN